MQVKTKERTMLKSFGEQMFEARHKKDISINKLAKTMGISHAFLSRLERGEVKAPSEDTTKRIADLLDLSFDELLMGAGRIPEDIKAKLTSDKKYLPIFRAMQSLTGEELRKVFDFISQLNLKRFEEE